MATFCLLAYLVVFAVFQYDGDVSGQFLGELRRLVGGGQVDDFGEDALALSLAIGHGVLDSVGVGGGAQPQRPVQLHDGRVAVEEVVIHGDVHAGVQHALLDHDLSGPSRHHQVLGG